MHLKDLIVLDSNELKKKYLEDKMTIKQIAEYYGLGKSTIQYKLKKIGVTTRTPEDLTGMIFGKLTVIRPIYKTYGPKNVKRKVWECICSCGNKKLVYAASTHLLSGHTTSCRCIFKVTGPDHPSYKGYGELSMSFWNAIRSSAKAREIQFNISIEFTWNLFLKQDRKCALSGIELKMHPMEKSMTRNTASLDRIDSSKGYTEDNVQWVHKKINIMKREIPEKEFINFCHNISEYQRNKNG